MSASTISDLNKKAYVHIEEWRNRELKGEYPYVYVDGIYLKRNWGGDFENVSILVAIWVNSDGYREVIGAAEGLKGVKMVVGDKCLGMCESVNEVVPRSQISALHCTFLSQRFLSNSPKQNA